MMTNKNRHDKHGGFMVNLMNVIYRIIPFLQADSSLGLSVRIPLRRGLREFFLLLLPCAEHVPTETALAIALGETLT